MKRVAVIGAGVFGCSAALELAKDFNVTVYDRSDNILTGASTTNHLRHHIGYHYPRSPSTVAEIRSGAKSFEDVYGSCLSEIFPAFYGISKINSKTSPEEFLKFCDSEGLPYELAWPDEGLIDRSRIAACIKTPERVYDPDILRGIILQRMRNLPITLKLNHEIIRGSASADKKRLDAIYSGPVSKDYYDFVVNATYSNLNSFNKWFELPQRKLQYELVELLELDTNLNDKVGLTIVDGEFSSLLPRGEKGTFTLGHVDASVISRVVADDIDPAVIVQGNNNSKAEEILAYGMEDFPFLANANVVKSHFVTRVVKASVDDTDERPTEITLHGNGLYSIFGGKVTTCVETARKLASIIREESF
jgi:hypothetical protein